MRFTDRRVYIIIIILVHWVERRFWRSGRINAVRPNLAYSPRYFPSVFMAPNRLVFIEKVNNVHISSQSVVYRNKNRQ
jgi:cytochrome oxidase assembly protein ShyY1